MWQELYEELKGFGFTVITVALDKSPDDARPWIEAAKPAHASLIDKQHVLADLYHMVNVPTIVWIDERGRIVRPNDVAFGSDMFKAITGLEAEKHTNALRTWVRGGAAPLSEAKIRSLQALPTPREQEARAEFALGMWLFERDRPQAAERHFLRGGELAPHDFMIRRGTMPIRGINPMGPEFVNMLQEWTAQGKSYYQPLSD